ncbi:OB-fold nucleic acid binding domain-containing protein [Halarchaeum nitratireducens]|uniref:DNA-binding protein n=1 Tax=Halarchaeum nitratireducens TaxID=489913 RepID=A0A830GG43_9EURY|nr:OB-fold nucleic acid binding domain-containing protein [Halarchaeum nitratireducens]GGN25354.1 DNA-binding protein [Halarchaeum nitratireducens]
MSSQNASQKVVSVDEQFGDEERETVDEDGFTVVAETPAFQATVQEETQAKVDANHPDGITDASQERIPGVTLAQEERIKAREAELERISAQAELGEQEGRAERARDVAAERSAAWTRAFERRAASVDQSLSPDHDPREMLSQEELGAVNEQASRLADELDGWSRAAISRQLAQAVRDGADIPSAVLDVKDELEAAPGQIIPINRVGDVDRQEVSVRGRVKTLWTPSSAKIAQVGLLEDDSGTIKFTVWEKSTQPAVAEGETVCIRGAARSWYQGRVSVTCTGWTTINFPERGRYWE